MNFRFFFTVGTLFSFVGGFVAFDSFLEFLFEDFFGEVSTFDVEKVIEVVEYVSIGGVVHDEIAFVEHGIEFFVEQSPNSGRGGSGLHEYLHVKE